MNRMFLVCIRRVQMHSTNKMILLTLVLYSCLLGLSQCYVNVALNKPAYQQNPFKTNYSMGDASNAVDGQKSNLTRNSGHCVLSAGTETATLWVNLTSTHNIQNVTIYFMTDNKQYVSSFFNKSSFLGFSVYVSNTTNRLQGTQCYTDTNFTLYTIPAVFTAVCSLLGQYVIYYNERLFDKAYPENYYHLTNNNLCEIEVYGCPATGCYGSNNSLPCPDVNCQQCHKQTGTCQVCKPGYKGQQCKLEFETGKYGVNCSKSCGNCLKQRQCQNVDGFCSKGCSAGYKGSLCTEPCKQTFHGINCSQKCNTNCRNQDCHHVTGKCIDSSKTEETGYWIIIGVSAAVIVPILCFFVCRLLWKRRGMAKLKDKYTAVSYPVLTTTFLKSDQNIINQPCTKGNKSETTTEYEDEDVKIDDNIHMQNPSGPLYRWSCSVRRVLCCLQPDTTTDNGRGNRRVLCGQTSTDTTSRVEQLRNIK